MHYIGMDVPISTREFAVINEAGHSTQEKRVPTGVKECMALISYTHFIHLQEQQQKE